MLKIWQNKNIEPHQKFIKKNCIGNFNQQLNENETKGYFCFQIYKFSFIFYLHFFCDV